MRSIEEILAESAKTDGDVRLSKDELTLIARMALTANRLEQELPLGMARSDWAFLLARAEARAAGLFGEAVYFTCPKCGPRVKAYEDGSCGYCRSICVETVGSW